MIFTSLELNKPDKIIKLFEYHPYWNNKVTREYNPDFDEKSSMIFRLKENKDCAIEYFFKEINPLLGKGFAIAVVPSHKPGDITSGIYRLAKRLVNCDRIDATSCLYRHTKINKLAKGGDRSIHRHFETIEVINSEIIRNQIVLLIDDVTTTGNSLRACQSILFDAGAKIVQCFALTKTVR